MYQNFYYSIFIWNSTCFGRHTAHHQEPKTALTASGFLYVEGCWTCSWWTLSGTYCAWQRPTNTRPITFHVWKTRGCQCSFRLLMMGGVSLKTCWVSYKYGIIKILIKFCTLLDFSLRIVLWCTDPRTEGFDISHTIRLTILQFVYHCNTTYNFTYALLSFLCKSPRRWKKIC